MSGTIVESGLGQLRWVPVGSYLIYYKVEDQRIAIVRILHAAQDREFILQNA